MSKEYSYLKKCETWKSVYSSTLKDEHWSSAFDPKLAVLLSELELGLGSVVRQSGAQPSTKKGHTEEDVLGMSIHFLQALIHGYTPYYYISVWTIRYVEDHTYICCHCLLTTATVRVTISWSHSKNLIHLYIIFFPSLPYAGILTPSDEFQYWADLFESAEKNSVRERARYFTELFKSIEKVSVCMAHPFCIN